MVLSQQQPEMLPFSKLLSVFMFVCFGKRTFMWFVWVNCCVHVLWGEFKALKWFWTIELCGRQKVTNKPKKKKKFEVYRRQCARSLWWKMETVYCRNRNWTTKLRGKRIRKLCNVVSSVAEMFIHLFGCEWIRNAINVGIISVVFHVSRTTCQIYNERK